MVERDGYILEDKRVTQWTCARYPAGMCMHICVCFQEREGSHMWMILRKYEGRDERIAIREAQKPGRRDQRQHFLG